MINDIVTRVRRNHGLEHGTVAVLLEMGARPPLGGYSTSGGFFIFGRLPTEKVAQAVYEAFERMSGGERELAVSPYCGTNLATGAMLAGILSSLIMGRTRDRGARLRRMPLALGAALGGALLGRPLGLELQRRFTTLADVENLEITNVRHITSVPYTIHRVSTRSVR
ncbi:MAG: DUF6391 domain-containing protein [Chloroflexi bacterium]|nr:DUF6391 domain-containing protein [Chloroflexota bacterium]